MEHVRRSLLDLQRFAQAHILFPEQGENLRLYRNHYATWGSKLAVPQYSFASIEIKHFQGQAGTGQGGDFPHVIIRGDFDQVHAGQVDAGESAQDMLGLVCGQAADHRCAVPGA